MGSQARPKNMNKIDELHLNITPGCIAMPEKHDPNELIVVPLGLDGWKHKGPPPFASVIAIEGERPIGAKARPAIHVFDIEGQYFYGDGPYCPEERCTTITCGISWPNLAAVLRNRRRKWDRFTEVAPDEVPYSRLADWQMKLKTWKPESDRFGPVEALRTCEKWNDKSHRPSREPQVSSTKETWDEKMYRILEVDAKRLKANQATSMAERFGDFCRNELGLKLDHAPDFTYPFTRLRAALDVAHIIVSGSAFPANGKLMSRNSSGNS